jgi:hypothetical protein
MLLRPVIRREGHRVLLSEYLPRPTHHGIGSLPRTSKIVKTTAITKMITLTHKPRSNFPIPESDRFMIVG